MQTSIKIRKVYIICFRVTIQKVPITTYLDPFADQDDEEIYLSEYEFSIDPKVRREFRACRVGWFQITPTER